MALLEAGGAVLGYLLLWGVFYRVGSRVIARRRTPAELRGDWWTAFERDFQAYLNAGRLPADDAARPLSPPRDQA